jgi:hypothetical protein
VEALRPGLYDQLDEATPRVLRLTLLAPDVVEAGLDGRQPPEITLAVLMRPFAMAWTEQRKTLIGCLPRSLACLDAVA